jgi:thiol-disulfide isomerase/thioredoxin
MKRNLVILATFLSFLSGCQTTNEVNISGKITGEIPDKIAYSVPVNGTSFFGFTETVLPDSLGNFQIKIVTKEPAFVILTIPGIDSKVVIAEPGQNFRISVNTENKPGSFKISGADEAGQNYYNTLPNPILVQLEARRFIKNPSQDSVKYEINALKENEIARLNELLNKKEISKSFFDLISIDRDCYYAQLITQVQYIKFLTNMSKTDPKDHYEFPAEMKKMWEDAYIRYPPEQKNLMRSHWWFEYAQSYLICKEFLSEDFKLQKIIDVKASGLEHTKNIEEAKKYFSGAGLEYYTAAEINFECLMFEEFEKEFIKIFDQFKIDFPDSKYTKYLEPAVQPIVMYYKIADRDFTEGIKFIEDYTNIGTLKDVVKALKGKKVYVDIWATWCGSCKQEFKSNDKLIRLLKSKGFEVLYISIDDDKKDATWKNMIKFYNLQGYHIRANKQLAADLRTTLNLNYVPYKFLIDENGNVAKDQSEIEGLEKGVN